MAETTKTGTVGGPTKKAEKPPQVQCLECSKKWRTRAMMPVCPRCNSVDIVLASEASL